MLFPFNNKLSIHHGMSTEKSQIPWPILSRRNRWCIDDKLIIFLVECCGGLETLNIRTMTKLCLSIASNNIVISTFLKIFFLLFEGSHHLNTLNEHSIMDRSWHLMIHG